MESTSTSGKIARSVHRRARARTRGEKNLLFEFFNERNPLPASTCLRISRCTLTDSPFQFSGGQPVHVRVEVVPLYALLAYAALR
jgi:hypothetical protein